MFNHPQHPTLWLRGKPRAYLSFSQDAALWGVEGRSHTTQPHSRHPARAPTAKVGDWEAWGYRDRPLSARREHGTETKRWQHSAPTILPRRSEQSRKPTPTLRRSLRPARRGGWGGVRRGRGGLEAGPGGLEAGPGQGLGSPLPDGDCSSGYKPGSLCRHWELRFPASERLR